MKKNTMCDCNAGVVEVESRKSKNIFTYCRKCGMKRIEGINRSKEEEARMKRRY